MITPTPIVFVHSGKSWYLPYALHQARLSNPNSPLWLIGDDTWPKGIQTINPSVLENEATRQFRQVFRPMSPNPPEFELMCYLRWFYLLEFMERQGLQEAYYFDSDVLLFGDCSSQREMIRNGGFECGLSIPKQTFESYVWTACGHASYWQISILREFCQFCIKSYKEDFYVDLYNRKMQWHNQEGIHGGICDMTTLYLFWREQTGRIFNLSKATINSVVDHNVVSTDNFEHREYLGEDGIKKIAMINRVPYFFTQADNQPVQVHSIHFQARKKLMPKYYTGTSFRGKFANELKMSIRSAPKRFRNWLRSK